MTARTPAARTVTRLPESHPYTSGCCAYAERHGVHRYWPVEARPLRHARRTTYRVSGTPRLAETALWRNLATLNIG